MSRRAEKSQLSSSMVVFVENLVCLVEPAKLDSYRPLRGSELMRGGSSDCSLYDSCLESNDLAWKRSWPGFVEKDFELTYVETGLLLGSEGGIPV